MAANVATICPPEIKAVLFDSGDTLITPIGWAWWPRPSFIRMLDPLGARIAPTDLEVPLNTGMRLLDRQHHVQSEEEEIAQFREYYEILLRELVLSSERE
jgi:hypothetical protein